MTINEERAQQYLASIFLNAFLVAPKPVTIEVAQKLLECQCLDTNYYISWNLSIKLHVHLRFLSQHQTLGIYCHDLILNLLSFRTYYVI